MSERTVELLAEFDELSEAEKQLYMVVIMQRAEPFDSGPSEDDEVTRASDYLFALID
jgi:hypothetical protein